MENSRLEIESLEPRYLLSGNVEVNLTDGLLHIDGDTADNAVEISFISPQEISVKGIDTLLNGQSGELKFRIESNSTLFFEGEDGDDRINFKGPGDWTGNFLFRTGAGNDEVLIGDVNISGWGLISTSSGNDSLGFKATKFSKHLILETGTGDDLVAMEDIEVGNISVVDVGRGSDSIRIDKATIDDSALILTGEGDDTLAITGTNIRRNFLVQTGTGNDFVRIETTSLSGRTVLATGLGNDSIVFGTNVSSNKSILVFAGLGFDSIAGQYSSNPPFSDAVFGRESNSVGQALIDSRLTDSSTGLLPKATALLSKIVRNTVSLTLTRIVDYFSPSIRVLARFQS